MSDTSIQWTDKVWNPLRGCSRISPGCLHCYAEKIASRFSDPGQPFHLFAERKPAPHWTGKVELIEDKLLEPLSWRKPCRCFVNSMSDLFHEKLPDEARDRIFAVMALCRDTTFQCLTKRADVMERYFQEDARGARHRVYNRSYGLSAIRQRAQCVEWPLPNVWLGVSVENREQKKRIEHLRRTPAAVRFLSLEPLLEDLGELDLAGIQWVIVGGESGPGARPCHLEWIRSIVRQCKAAGTKCFVKQWGSRPYFEYLNPNVTSWDDIQHIRAELKDRKGGDPAEWPEDIRIRQFPEGVNVNIQIETILPLYESGKTAREIAAEVGCSKSGVLRTLNANGIVVRKASRRVPAKGASNPNWKRGWWLSDDGYRMVTKDGKPAREHRVVAEALPGEIVHHRDGNRLNNDPGNLEVLPSHAAHRAKHLDIRPAPLCGEDNPRAKLNSEAVLAILKSDQSSRKLAKSYGVSKTIILKIRRAELWRCLPEVREFPEARA